MPVQHHPDAEGVNTAGGQSQLRSGFTRLMEAVRDHELDLVVAESLDRLSRDQEDSSRLFKGLRFSWKLEGLIDALAEGIRSATIKEKIGQLEHRQSELGQELSGRRAAPPRLPADPGSLYRSKVESLQQSLLEPAGRTEAIELLQGLIDRVEVRPTGRGRFEFELVGDLASMIELGLDSKTPAHGGAGVLGSYRSSVKVVAGTGLRLYRTKPQTSEIVEGPYGFVLENVART
jgi:Resolvase, N terminal domain